MFQASDSSNRVMRHGEVGYILDAMRLEGPILQKVLEYINLNGTVVAALPDVLPPGHSILRFNAHEDVICLVKLSLNILTAVNIAVATYRVQLQTDSDTRGRDITRVEDTSQWLRKVKSLAFEVRETSMDTGFGFSLERGMGYLIHFISIFAGLQWLFLVALPSPDDMKTVKCWTSCRSAKHIHPHFVPIFSLYRWPGCRARPKNGARDSRLVCIPP